MLYRSIRELGGPVSIFWSNKAALKKLGRPATPEEVLQYVKEASEKERGFMLGGFQYLYNFLQVRANLT